MTWILKISIKNKVTNCYEINSFPWIESGRTALSLMSFIVIRYWFLNAARSAFSQVLWWAGDTLLKKGNCYIGNGFSEWHRCCESKSTYRIAVSLTGQSWYSGRPPGAKSSISLSCLRGGKRLKMEWTMSKFNMWGSQKSGISFGHLLKYKLVSTISYLY